MKCIRIGSKWFIRHAQPYQTPLNSKLKCDDADEMNYICQGVII